MAKSKKYTVDYKRKRSGLTNYRKRLRLLKSEKLRLVIRKSLNNLVIQAVSYDSKGDKVLSSISTKHLLKFGWNAYRGNIPSAYLTGLLAGKKFKKLNVKELIVDFGLQKKGLRLYSALKGVIDTGIKVPCSEKKLPDEKIISGEKIAEYAKSLDEDKYKKQFSNYIKNKIDVKNFTNYFNEVKKKIMEE
jgi:large subunit ribosomal protein L18